MKKTEKYIVVRSLETGQYLMKYESKDGALTYSAVWTDELQDAATNDLEVLNRYNDKMQKIAEMFDGELLVVNATYELKTLDGNEPKDLMEEIEEAKRKHFENFLRGLLEVNDDEEED
jgi:hypothetical protein